MSESVWLERPGSDVPWGFRLHGGRDFHVPLSVQKVTGGSLAAMHLQAGDVITSIGDAETAPLTHTQAMQVIKSCGDTLQLGITRRGATATGSHQLLSPQTSVTSPTQYTGPSSQNPFEHHQMSDNTAGSSLGYNEVSSPGTHVTTAGTNSADYPFTMQLSYPASDYSSLDQDYTVVGRGDDPMFNSWTADEFESSMTPTSPSHPSSQQQQQPGPPVPDAVINMAAKVGSDKKPFAYVADVNDIRQQRERVRRKQPAASSLPRYQHMLNLPQFEEQPPARSHGNAPAGQLQRSQSGGGGTPQAGEGDDNTAVISNLQFNSPLDLYSGENVVEALQGQTGAHISSVVGMPKSDQKSDITQSSVYKMIHGIDQPRPRPRAPPTPTEERPPAVARAPTEEEMKFTGLSRGEGIPSKSFQRLQSMTGTGGEDQSSEPGQYDQKSIRYTGRNIPSRSFRMLQSMTGGDVSASPAPASDDELTLRFRSRSETPQRPVHRSQGQGQGQGQTGGSEIDTSSYRHHLLGTDDSSPADVGDYDQTSIRYTGRNIPSRSFRMLQHLTGGADDVVTPPAPSHPSPRRHVVQPHHPAARRIQAVPGAGVQAPAHHGPATSDDTDQRHATPPSHADLPQHRQETAVNGGGAAGGVGADVLQSTAGRKVKVVRLRQQASVEDQGATEF